MERHFIGLGILMFFLSTLPVSAGAPLDTVQINVNKVLDVLRDPKLKAEPAKEIKKEKLGQGFCLLDSVRGHDVLPVGPRGFVARDLLFGDN